MSQMSDGHRWKKDIGARHVEAKLEETYTGWFVTVCILFIEIMNYYYSKTVGRLGPNPTVTGKVAEWHSLDPGSGSCTSCSWWCHLRVYVGPLLGV